MGMSEKALNIIFMGTPDFAALALKALLGTQHNVVAVYSQPPRPKGRGKAVQKSAVHILTEENDIPVYTPKSLKNEDTQKEFQSLNADVGVVAAYGLILPKEILEAPRFGCLNIHGSLLPRWRGAAPIQRAIEAGDDKTGITIMQMNEGLDTGPMIMKGEVAITPQTTASSLHDDLAIMGGDLIIKMLDILANKNRLCHDPQNDADATYAAMLKKEEGHIDWSQTGEEIHRQIRAFTPWPGTYSMHSGKRLKIHQAILSDHKTDQTPGTILNKEGNIACGDRTVLCLDIIQPENKKRMSFTDAMNGGVLSVGDILS